MCGVIFLRKIQILLDRQLRRSNDGDVSIGSTVRIHESNSTCFFRIFINLTFRAIIAEKLVEYMSFKSYYETVGPKEDIPLLEFMERIPREVVLELYVFLFSYW